MSIYIETLILVLVLEIALKTQTIGRLTHRLLWGVVDLAALIGFSVILWRVFA